MKSGEGEDSTLTIHTMGVRSHTDKCGKTNEQQRQI